MTISHLFSQSTSSYPDAPTNLSNHNNPSAASVPFHMWAAVLPFVELFFVSIFPLKKRPHKGHLLFHMVITNKRIGFRLKTFSPCVPPSQGMNWCWLFPDWFPEANDSWMSQKVIDFSMRVTGLFWDLGRAWNLPNSLNLQRKMTDLSDRLVLIKAYTYHSEITAQMLNSGLVNCSVFERFLTRDWTSWQPLPRFCFKWSQTPLQLLVRG